MTRKKKLPVVKVAEQEVAAAVAGSLPAEVAIALDDVAGAIREGLLAFCCGRGAAGGEPDHERGADRQGRPEGQARPGPFRDS